MAQPIYANDFGGLTQADQNAEQIRGAALSRALNTFVTVQAGNKNRALQSRQLQYQQGNEAQQQDNWQKEYLLRLGDQTIRKAAETRLENTPSPLDQKTAADEVKGLFDIAGTGAVESPEHARKLAPHATDADIAQAQAISDAADRQNALNYTHLVGAAKVLNAPRHLKFVSDQIDSTAKDAIAADSKWYDPTSWATPTTGIISKLADQKKSVAQQLVDAQTIGANIQKDKSIMQNLTIDPDTGAYVPAIPPPRSLVGKFQSTQSTGTQAPPAAAAAPAAPARTAPASTQSTGTGAARIVIQRGNKFQINPDGTTVYIGPAQ